MGAGPRLKAASRDAIPKGRRKGLERLAREVHGCRRCPRLVAWREAVASDPPRRFRGERCWARPVSGFGDPRARIVLVGLAPAASNGANRTGRMFTGDRSGEWLYAALHRAGLSNRAASERRDGLRLRGGAYVTAVNRCPAAPPAGRRRRSATTASRTWRARPAARAGAGPGRPRGVRVGRCAAGAGARARDSAPQLALRARREVEVGPFTLLGCFHPSQRNTFTGRLTEAMMDAIWLRPASWGAHHRPQGHAARKLALPVELVPEPAVVGRFSGSLVVRWIGTPRASACPRCARAARFRRRFRCAPGSTRSCGGSRGARADERRRSRSSRAGPPRGGAGPDSATPHASCTNERGGGSQRSAG